MSRSPQRVRKRVHHGEDPWRGQFHRSGLGDQPVCQEGLRDQAKQGEAAQGVGPVLSVSLSNAQAPLSARGAAVRGGPRLSASGAVLQMLAGGRCRSRSLLTSSDNVHPHGVLRSRQSHRLSLCSLSDADLPRSPVARPRVLRLGASPHRPPGSFLDSLPPRRWCFCTDTAWFTST